MNDKHRLDVVKRNGKWCVVRHRNDIVLFKYDFKEDAVRKAISIVRREGKTSVYISGD